MKHANANIFRVKFVTAPHSAYVIAENIERAAAVASGLWSGDCILVELDMRPGTVAILDPKLIAMAETVEQNETDKQNPPPPYRKGTYVLAKFFNSDKKEPAIVLSHEVEEGGKLFYRLQSREEGGRLAGIWPADLVELDRAPSDVSASQE